VKSCKPAYFTLTEPSSEKPRTALESVKPVGIGDPRRGRGHRGGFGGAGSVSGVWATMR
jgi:ribosomal protein L15